MSELRSSERASHEAPKVAWLLAKVPQPTSMDRNAFLAFVATERGSLVKGGDGVAFYQILPQHTPPGPVYLESPSFRGLVFYEGLF